MNSYAKLMGALSLSRKAGALQIGFDAVHQSVLGNEAALVLLAQDLSPATCKRVLAFSRGRCPVRQLPLTQQHLAAIARKPAGVLAVADKNLAALCAGAADMEQLA